MSSTSRAAAWRPGDGRHFGPILRSARTRPDSRRSRLWAWLLVVVAAPVRAHGAAGDLRAAPAHPGGLWLAC